MFFAPRYRFAGQPQALARLQPSMGGRSLFPSYDPTTVIYVSAVAKWGIPVGDDTTGAGTRAAPYLTLAKAYSVATTGKVILLNGDPASPTDYRHATVFQLNRAVNVTIDSVAAMGASVSSTTTTGGIILSGGSNQAGTTNTLGKIIVDGRGLNLYGLLGQSTTATPYTIICNGTKFTGCTLYPIAPSTTTNTHIQLVLNNVMVVHDGGRSCIDHQFAAGDSSLRVDGGTFTATNQLYLYGFLRMTGKAAGTICSINGVNFYRTAGTTGVSINQAIAIIDVAGVVFTNNTISLNDPAGKSAGGDKAIVLMTSTAGAALDMSGFVITGNTFYHDNPGGGGVIFIGSDSTGVSPYTQADGKLNNGVVANNLIVGSNASATGQAHGIFNSCQANTLVYRNRVLNMGIGAVEKGGLNAVWYSNLFINCYSSCMLMKGATNPTFLHNTAVQKSYVGPLISMNANAGVADTSGGQWIGNLLVNMGSGALVAAKVDASQIATFGYNDYIALGAGAISWNWLGVAKATLALWKTASGETTATALDPLFVDAPNDNYALQAGSPVKGLVPANVNAPTDYIGAPFLNPASVGAYQ